MKILFTHHANKKFKDLAALNVLITKTIVKKTLLKPEHLDTETDSPKKIASAEFDKDRILRIVYKEENGIITVITFYPAKKGRYF